MEVGEVSYTLANEEEFWDELGNIVADPGESYEGIDNALREFLGFAIRYKDDILCTPDDLTRCSYQLCTSPLFAHHADYVRRQIIHSLLQEDDGDMLHLIASFLLVDGRRHEDTFFLMNEEGCFPRLLQLVQLPGRHHRVVMELLYEMARIQKVKLEDLVQVEDGLVRHLFDIIEGLSDDASDPYHYPVIRVLLVLNEQFMVCAHDPSSPTANPPTNKVIKILAMHGNRYKTFGENIILLLNREGETSLQLLTLKLLYLIFTTPATCEYFYTNDLHVLVDILIRNLLDLPPEAVALRHTYLRVLHPLLAHTQLKDPPHYKRNEIRRTLGLLVNRQFNAEDGTDDGEGNEERIAHFAEADETTKRLVARCSQVEWLLRDNSRSPTPPPGVQTPDVQVTEPAQPSPPTSPTITTTDKPVDEHDVLLLPRAETTSSPHSVSEVATQREAPGVVHLHRTGSGPDDEKHKPPEPPTPRRSRARARTPRRPSPVPDEPPHQQQQSEAKATATKPPPPPPPRSHSRPRAPPPAVPPPRRSAAAHHPPLPTAAAATAAAAAAAVAAGPAGVSAVADHSSSRSRSSGKRGVAPEPPKARRHHHHHHHHHHHNPPPSHHQHHDPQHQPQHRPSSSSSQSSPQAAATAPTTAQDGGIESIEQGMERAGLE